MAEKGKRFERAERARWDADGFQPKGTRAGYERDAGDNHVAPRVIQQCKHTKDYRFAQWLDELAEQMTEAGAEVGILTVKRSLPGKPPLILDVIPRHVLVLLLQRSGYAPNGKGDRS
ncbi:hypothetical protein [Nocardia brasiliensis]|nr:hypothetical protein [Nocardia brasiliensis]